MARVDAALEVELAALLHDRVVQVTLRLGAHDCVRDVLLADRATPRATASWRRPATSSSGAASPATISPIVAISVVNDATHPCGLPPRRHGSSVCAPVCTPTSPGPLRRQTRSGAGECSLRAPMLSACRMPRRGLLFGVAAYVMWGAFPLYWPLLEPAGAFEILAHRILWSCITMAVVVVALRRTGQFRAILRNRRVRTAADRRRRGDHRQLGDVHLGRQQRPGGRDVAGLLHQPAGDGPDGRLHPRASGSARCSGSRWASPPTAVVILTLDYGRLPVRRPDPGLLLRQLRPVQEDRERRRHREPGLRDDRDRAVRRRVRRLSRRHRRLELRCPRPRPRAALHVDRHRHRDPADLLRRRRHPGLDGDPGPAAVPRPDPPVRARRPLLPRGHDPRPLGRLRPGLDRAGDLHRRGWSTTAAGSCG